MQIDIRTTDLDLRKPSGKRSLGAIDEGEKRYLHDYIRRYT